MIGQQAPLPAMAAWVSVSAAFGLQWGSMELDLPELAVARDENRDPDVIIQPEDSSTWPAIEGGPSDTPFLQMAGGDLRLTVEQIGQFRITGGTHIAWHRDHPGVSDQDLRTFLLGSAVGALLIQRGMLVLHGNALERDGQAIVCLGQSGAGKSTLAYALMRQGWRLLADDLVAVTPDGCVLPGIPRIKLWHDAAKAFGLDPGKLPPIRQGLHKYLLMGDAVQRATAATPLKAMYLLRQNREEATTAEVPRITRIQSQKTAALRLRNQAFRPRFVRGLGQEGANFMAMARLQRTVPLAVLPVPSGIAAMQAWLEQQDLLQAAAGAAPWP